METPYLLLLLLALSTVDMQVSMLSLSNTTQAQRVTNSNQAITRSTSKNAATTRSTSKNAATTRSTSKNAATTRSTSKNAATTRSTSKNAATTRSTSKHTGEISITPTTATERTNASNISERSPQTSKTPGEISTTPTTGEISITPTTGETSITPTTDETLVTPTTERSRQTSKTTVQPIVSENTKKPYIIEIDLDQTKAELKLSMSVPANFDEALREKTSEQYIKLEYEFKQQLTEAFTPIPGFLSIDILQFVNVNGCVVADLRVNFRPDLTDMQHAIKFIENNASMLLHSVNISGQHPKILQGNSSYSYQLKDGSMGSLCPFLAPTTCPFGYICQQAPGGRVYCEDRCILNRTFCHNDGECFVDHRNDKLKCKCLDTNSDYYFSGENCQFIKPKGNSSPSSLSVKDYAIIGGVAAAAILVILVLFLGVRALRKSFVNSKDKDIGNDDESFSSNISTTHVSVHMSHMDVSNPHERQGIDNTAEVFDSGLPQVTTNDLKLYRDSQANRDSQAKHEAFVYQPSNLSGPLSSSIREFDSPEIDRKLEQNGRKNTSSNKNSKKYIL